MLLLAPHRADAEPIEDLGGDLMHFAKVNPDARGVFRRASCEPGRGDCGHLYRVMYVAKYEEAVYVLHCFQKKTQTTSKRDKAIAAARYRAVANARKEKK